MTIVLEKKGREGEECEIWRMRRLGRKRSKVWEGKGRATGEGWCICLGCLFGVERRNEFVDMNRYRGAGK